MKMYSVSLGLHSSCVVVPLNVLGGCNDILGLSILVLSKAGSTAVKVETEAEKRAGRQEP